MTRTGTGQYSGSLPTSGLTPGLDYYLYVRVYDADGNILAENNHHDVIMANNPALAPKNFQVTKVLKSTPPAAEQFNLKFSWDSATNAATYNLYRTKDKTVQLFQDPCTIQQVDFGHRYGDPGATTPFCETTIQQHDGTDDSNSWVPMATISGDLTSYTVPWSQVQSDLPNDVYFYILRAANDVGESGYSTMAFTAKRIVTYNSDLGNTNWISMPYQSVYSKASDIINDVEGGTGNNSDKKISSVSLWAPDSQDVVTYRYNSNLHKWAGNDFAIQPGDGISLIASNTTSSFDWTITGSDTINQKIFDYNASLGNTYWLSMPYSGKYLTASDIIQDIEGGTGNNKNRKISSVALWTPGSQDVATYRYASAQQKWIGTNFNVKPGDGISFILSGNSSTFDWNDVLIINPYR